MTKERLAEIRARLAAATPGPWHVGPIVKGSGILFVMDSVGKKVADCTFSRDSQFVANASADIAVLLTEVERLQAERGGLSHALACVHARWAKGVLND